MKKEYSLEKIVDLQCREIIILHDIFVNIISDKNPILTFKFQECLTKGLGSHLYFSINFHPLLDWQLKKTIQTFDDLLEVSRFTNPSPSMNKGAGTTSPELVPHPLSALKPYPRPLHYRQMHHPPLFWSQYPFSMPRLSQQPHVVVTATTAPGFSAMTNFTTTITPSLAHQSSTATLLYFFSTTPNLFFFLSLSLFPSLPTWFS